MPTRKPFGILFVMLIIMAAIPAFNIQASLATLTLTPTATVSAPVATSTTVPCTYTATQCALLATDAATIANSFKCTLSVKDCALLATAQANVAAETSFQQSFSFKVNLTSSGSKPVNIQASGQGMFSIDPGVNTSNPDSLYSAIQFQLNINGSAAQQAGKTGIVIKDGILYIQDPRNGAWTGVNLLQVIALSRESQATTAQTAINQAAQKTILDLAADPDFVAAYAALPNIPGWIVQKRLPTDAFLEGQRMAQIQYTYNPQVLLQSPLVAKIIKKFFTALANNLPADTPSLDAYQTIARLNDVQMQGVLLIVSGFFGKTNIQYTRWIGETDKKIHALNGVINVNLVPAALNFNGSTTAVQPPINGTITFSVQVTKIGQPVTVTVPPKAQIISEGQLRQAFDRINSSTSASPSSTLTPGVDASFPPQAPTYDSIPVGTAKISPSGSAYPVAFPTIGNPNAPIKIEEISSFSCPFCLQYHDRIFANIQDEIKAGRVQFIDIPTTLTGDFDAHPGSYAAVCAMQQGKFWQMSDILYFWQTTYGAAAANRDRLEQAASHLNLDLTKFDACMLSPETSSYVDASNNYANSRGLVGTPTVFLFVNGVQMQTPANLSSNGITPGSVAGLSLSDLRKILEGSSASTIITPTIKPTNSPTMTPTLTATK